MISLDKDRPSHKDAHDAYSEPSILSLSTICSKILISLAFDKSVTDGLMDGRTDGRTVVKKKGSLILVNIFLHEVHII